MKMDPDLLMTLSDPGAKSDREPPLLTLGPLPNGKYFFLEPRRGAALPSPELVLLSRETPAGHSALLLPGDGKPLALERVLNGMKLAKMDPRQTLFPDGPLEFLYRVEKEQEMGPISDGQTEPGVGDNHNDPDCPGEGLDVRLAPVREALAFEESTTWREEEQLASCSLGQAESLVPQDLQVVAEEWREGDPQEALPVREGLVLAGVEEGPLDRLLPSAPWTLDMDSCEAQSCQQRPLLRPLDLAVAPQMGLGVDLFPSLGSPNNLSPPLEFGHAEHIEDESTSSLDDAPLLQAVFDTLDGDGDGFVRIEDFVQFATVYGAEQVKDLTKFLDPAGLGVISFEDFCRGISAIRNGADPDNQLCTMGYTHDELPTACPDEFDDFVTFEANEVTDSAYMGSESTYSECETFTDEDTSTLVHHEMHDEVETDSAIDSTVHSEFTDPVEEPENNGSHPHDLPLTSDINNHSIVTVISGEEHFEDYGEGNEVDLFSDSLCNGESGFSSSSFLSPSPNKRFSSKKVARHLHQTGTLTVDAMEEPYRNNTECLEEDITDKVIFLEKRVIELEKDTAANGEQHSRLKQENLQLVHRANALEEQLKEQELQSDQALMEEIRKQREMLSKMEREKSIEVENLQARLQQLDDENGELRSCVPCLRANIERLEEEKQKLLDEIEDLTVQLNEEQESKRKLGDKLTQERHQFQKDKELTQELIEDLRRQLEHLQLFKLEAEQRRGRSSSIGLQEYNSRTRETELEQEIRRLKQDNRNLKEQNDELNGQIINLSIQGAKNLFSASFSESLAAEISSVSRDELMEAIQKQEEINFRLQDYIDRIIVAIMETNPSILEVK
ncbi:rab11 family-interacting protein 3 isoform X3 [Rhineura floridana]|uniref:rab11 family-interacting protein 3 isoform X3 n=1 Tax=Rhineura floridana TaxID=261503 RepID=UPI002AC8230E|nr:rab11 family-interacting protein 3 isoform X3 [Rhineura floridana]